MPFIGNAGQFSNIHEKNYATSNLHVIEGDTLYHAYNEGSSHYKLLTTLQEITSIGSVTANTIQFTNNGTSLVTNSNIGIANQQPMHTIDVGANVYIDDVGANTIHTTGKAYAKILTGDTADIAFSVMTNDVIVDRVYPKSYGYISFEQSNVGIRNNAPIHTLDIGSNIQIDEYGSNTFYTSGNVYSEHLKSSNVTVSGTIDTDEAIINHVNSKSTDFVNFTSNIGILNTAPIHTLDVGANVQIDEYGSNTFYTSGNVHATRFTGDEMTIAGAIVAESFVVAGQQGGANPTPTLQSVSEKLPQAGQIAFSSDRTLTLSNVTYGMNTTVINAITTNSNLVGDNVTVVTTNSNLVGDNVTVVTTNSNLIGDNVTVVTTNSNLIGDNVTVVTTNSNLIGDNVTVVTTNSNLIAGNVTVDSNLIVNTDDLVVDTVNSRVGINKLSPTKDLDVTGEIACSSDLTVGGNIIGNSNTVFRKFTLASSGYGHYTVIGPGFDTIKQNPTLTLMRGQKYVFDNTVHSSHPLEIRDGYDGNAYTDGVSGTSTITFEVPMDAPIKLYYQCKQHSTMGNIIYIPESTLDTTMALNLSNNLVVNTNDFVVDTVNSNVGIGVTSPAYKLDVDGDINIASGSNLRIGGSVPIYSRWTANGPDIYRSSKVGIANTNPQHELSVGGSVRHEGLVTTDGTNIDQIKSITKNLGVTVGWMDTGISGTNLATGSYIVQIENHSDSSSGSYRNYNEYYTGFMSWYSESNGTNDTDASEIILHAAGRATEDNHIYLRVLRQVGSVLKLQIRRDFDRSGQNVDYKFKFRRMI
jgi:hypothetical protein